MSEPTSNLSQDVAQQFLRRGQLIQYVLASLLAVILIWALINWYLTRDEPAIQSIDITAITLVSPAVVCPGEMVMINLRVHIEGEGKVERDVTIQSISPAKTIIFSEPLRFSVIGPIDQEYLIPWRVPERYLNFETGQTEIIPPGDYFRIITLSAQGYRYMISDTDSIQFTIRGDCNNGPDNNDVGTFGNYHSPNGFEYLVSR